MKQADMILLGNGRLPYRIHTIGETGSDVNKLESI
jgi:hypothetical protein